MVRKILARLAPLLLAFLTTGCASFTVQPRQPLLVDVTRSVDGWQARYTMPIDARAWAFHRSGLAAEGEVPWRPQRWRVATPGVSLARIGEFDVLVAEDGDVPREVIIAFDVAPLDIVSDHDPAVFLSDGSIALYTGHFSAFPMFRPDNLADMTSGYAYPSRLTFGDGGRPVRHNGIAAESVSAEEDGYVLFGTPEPVTTEYGSLIVDPGLPEWLASEVIDYAGPALEFYARRMGPAGRRPPTVVAAWGGPTEDRAFISGTLADSTLTLSLEGAFFETRSYPALVYTQRLVGHEVGHIWLGEAIGYEKWADTWITEGGTVLMAERLQEALNARNAEEEAVFGAVRRLAALEEGREIADVPSDLDKAREACPKWLDNGALAEAFERRERRAFYDCGAMFALAVEQAGAARGEDFFDFFTLLQQRNADGFVSGDEWLDAAEAFGLPDRKRAIIARLLAEGSADGEADMVALLDD